MTYAHGDTPLFIGGQFSGVLPFTAPAYPYALVRSAVLPTIIDRRRSAWHEAVLRQRQAPPPCAPTAFPLVMGQAQARAS